MWLIYYIIFAFVGAFGALGILFSYIYNLFQEDKGYDILLTEGQAAKYADTKSSKESNQSCTALESEIVPPPPPGSHCLQCVYNFVTNAKFDAVVLVLIIIDNVVAASDYYYIHAHHATFIRITRYAILLLYIVELIVKIMAWGRHYFRSGWNWLDFLTVLIGAFCNAQFS